MDAARVGGTWQLRHAVFISYRRDESADIAGRVYDRLAERFGKDQVFEDVDSLRPGEAFPEYIAGYINQSAVALVIIGPRWLNAAMGPWWWRRRRLKDKRDWVRREIELALAAGATVVPTLVAGAALPPAKRLPRSLRPMVERNSLHVRSGQDFARDMDGAVTSIEHWIEQARQARQAPPPEAQGRGKGKGGRAGAPDTQPLKAGRQRARNGAAWLARLALGLLTVGVVALTIYSVWTQSGVQTPIPAIVIPTPTPTPPPPPTASFTAREDTEPGGLFGTCVTHFDASGSFSQASIVDYSWQFGDNQTDDAGGASQTTHDYSGPGWYSVTLTVTDNYGQTGTVTEPVGSGADVGCF